eukprot:906375-Prymnesium_polylepis.1
MPSVSRPHARSESETSARSSDVKAARAIRKWPTATRGQSRHSRFGCEQRGRFGCKQRAQALREHAARPLQVPWPRPRHSCDCGGHAGHAAKATDAYRARGARRGASVGTRR